MASEKNPQQIQPPDWTIEELYRKAWATVKKNKILWIFGAAIGGGMNFNNSINFDANDFETIQKFFENKPSQPTDGFEVLGTMTGTASGMVFSLFSGVPFWMYIVLIGEILLLILIGIAISVIYQAWATGALLENIQMCIKDGKATIREASEKAFGYLKPLLWLNIIPGLLIGVASLIVFLFLGIGFGASEGPIQVLFGVLLFVATLAALYAGIILTVTLIWAPRIVVSNAKSGKDALLLGYRIGRKKFWPSFILGIVNTIVTGLAIAAPIAFVIALIIAGVIVGAKYEQTQPVLILLGSILALAMIVVFTIVTAVVNAFKATIWSLAYDKINGKYDK